VRQLSKFGWLIQRLGIAGESFLKHPLWWVGTTNTFREIHLIALRRCYFDVRKLCEQQWKEGGVIKRQIAEERDRIKRELKQLADNVETATQP